jgi:hypothetical protein
MSASCTLWELLESESTYANFTPTRGARNESSHPNITGWSRVGERIMRDYERAPSQLGWRVYPNDPNRLRKSLVALSNSIGKTRSQVGNAFR